MSVNTSLNEMSKYFNNLSATNTICTAFGTTFTEGKNLFMVVEPAEATRCLTIIPYGGGYSSNKDRQSSFIQIRVKSDSFKTCLETSQAIINDLHFNDSVCASQPGIIFADQGSPMFLPSVSGGEYKISVSNYTIKHIKF